MYLLLKLKVIAFESYVNNQASGHRFVTNFW